MNPQVRIDMNGRPDELDRSIIRFGPTAREDKDSELHVYRLEEDKEATRLIREFVGGVKSKKFDFPHGDQYVVIVIGDKTAGVASTAPETLVAPFNVFMNPPEDHSKDYMRLDIPANRPIVGDLRRSILASLKEK